ncbi:hypothetical protein GCM10009646_61790 [Streptomyces aureus]
MRFVYVSGFAGLVSAPGSEIFLFRIVGGVEDSVSPPRQAHAITCATDPRPLRALSNGTFECPNCHQLDPQDIQLP